MPGINLSLMFANPGVFISSSPRVEAITWEFDLNSVINLKPGRAILIDTSAFLIHTRVKVVKVPTSVTRPSVMNSVLSFNRAAREMF